MNIRLEKATSVDAQVIFEIQVRAFNPWLEKYKDYDTNPANETIERVIKRINNPNGGFYKILVIFGYFYRKNYYVTVLLYERTKFMKTTNYSNIANKYDKNQYRVDEIKHETDLKEYIDSNKKSEYHVLDLSCGTGLYLEKQMNFFEGQNIKWNGLDASKAMLKKAQKGWIVCL